jgi:hypothetical protein
LRSRLRSRSRTTWLRCLMSGRRPRRWTRKAAIPAEMRAVPVISSVEVIATRQSPMEELSRPRGEVRGRLVAGIACMSSREPLLVALPPSGWASRDAVTPPIATAVPVRRKARGPGRICPEAMSGQGFESRRPAREKPIGGITKLSSQKRGCSFRSGEPDGARKGIRHHGSTPIQQMTCVHVAGLGTVLRGGVLRVGSHETAVPSA